jgi:Cu2+-exporting ATPase
MKAVIENLAGGGAQIPARVRGPEAAKPTPARLCRHCGSPLLSAAASEPGFCCSGCAYVFRLVNEHGLENYYHIRDAVTPPVSPAVFEPRDHAWLAELQATAENSSATPELTLGLQGLSCAGCVWLIERLFQRQAGSLEAEANPQLGTLRLRWARGACDVAAFAQTLQSFGYLVGAPGAEPAGSESRLLVTRVGLCAAFAMNTMLFTLPVYFGMRPDAPYARLFGLLSLGFATLSVAVGGSYFLNRAWSALRRGIMHIDLPIAIGILGAYLGSVGGWILGREALVYFDFVSAFVLLMLIGRWAQTAAVEQNRRRLLASSMRPERVRVLRAGTAIERTLEELRAGDSIEIRTGETVPVEARLESTAATFGLAWITGEADPRDCRAGARVPAGAVNLSRMPVRLFASQPWSASLLARLWQPAERASHRHRFLERIVSGYLVAIFTVAIVAGTGWWFTTHDPVRTWSAVIAVLVVSCPCAIGLAFPLADELATVAMRQAGVFVREPGLWPRLGRIRKIVFDKTGTLTLENPVLQSPAALATLAPEARSALFALVQDSPHPVSQSLRENLLAGNLVPPEPASPDEWQEEPGQGVTLRWGTTRWSLGRPGWRNNATTANSGPADGKDFDTVLARDGKALAYFRFTDSIRPGVREEIQALRAEGREVFILSGDRHEKVETLAAALGLPVRNALGGLSPEEKASWLRQHDRSDTMMLGDGANDSLAFNAAFACGTPVIHRGVLGEKADFYYLGRGLAGLRRLFAVDAMRRKTQAGLLVFSIAYNLLAVGLAASGHMNPLLAAIFMPVSSLVTLALVALGMRRARQFRS